MARTSLSLSGATLRPGSRDGTRNQRAPARSGGDSRLGGQGPRSRYRPTRRRPDPCHPRADGSGYGAHLLVELVGPRSFPPPSPPRPALLLVASSPAHTRCERLTVSIRPSFEAVGLPGPTLEGGHGCICTLTPSSDWPVVSPWCRRSKEGCR